MKSMGAPGRNQQSAAKPIKRTWLPSSVISSRMLIRLGRHAEAGWALEQALILAPADRELNRLRDENAQAACFADR